MAAKTAGQDTLDTNEATLFDKDLNGTRCSEFTVFNHSDSDDDVLINVVGLHKAGEFFHLAPGKTQPFFHQGKAIEKVTAKAVTTATIDHGVTGI